MANDIYILDQLVTGTLTVTVTDDGTGSDWLTVQGVYNLQTDLRLAWSTDAFGNADEAMGLYFLPDNIGHRLVIEGVIENIRGSNGLDYIQGNERANILYGDQAAGGLGDADSIYGYDGRDTIYGGAGNDDIGGGNDDDLMVGGAGVDSISGGGGVDTVIGGAGADVLAGGSSPGDMVSYAGSNAGVRIAITFGSATTGIGGHAAGDQVFGFSDVTGSDHADILRDTVKTTIGFGNNDNRFFGAAGNDRLELGGGNDQGRGGTGRDLIFGEVGNDTLFGDAGADTLRGGEGADQLFGGSAADRFVFALASESTPALAGRDTIRDFSRAEADRIDLSLFNVNPGSGGAFAWRGSLGFTGTAAEVRWTVSGGNVMVLADQNGDGTADLAVVVQGMASLLASDFIL